MRILDDEERPAHVLTALETCFRMAFNQSSDEMKRKTAMQLVKIIKEESEYVVITHETAFFRASDLEYVSPDDIELVKHHLLGRMKKHMDIRLLDALRGIGAYLSREDVSAFVDPIVKVICFSKDGKLTKMAEDRLGSEYHMRRNSVTEAISQRLDDWVAIFHVRKELDHLDAVTQVRDSLAMPF